MRYIALTLLLACGGAGGSDGGSLYDQPVGTPRDAGRNACDWCRFCKKWRYDPRPFPGAPDGVSWCVEWTL